MAVYGAIQLVGSAARTTSSDNHSSPITHAWRYREACFFLYCSAASGTTPTLDVTVETYDLYSQLWFPVASFTQLITTGSELIRVAYGLGYNLSVKWVIGGTTPSFTFQVNAALKD
jgi:hypothetical protein